MFGAGKPAFGGTEVVGMGVRVVEWPPAGTDGSKPLFRAGKPAFGGTEVVEMGVEPIFAVTLPPTCATNRNCKRPTVAISRCRKQVIKN